MSALLTNPFPRGVALRWLVPGCVFVLVFAVLVLAAHQPISTSKAEQLSADVQPLLKSMCGADVAVPGERWPRSVRDLTPERVWFRAGDRTWPDGMYITTWTFFVQEHGLFMPCDAKGFSGSPGGDPGYKRLSDGVYWYRLEG